MKLCSMFRRITISKLNLSAPFFPLSFPYVGSIVTTTGPYQLTYMATSSHIFTLSYTLAIICAYPHTLCSLHLTTFCLQYQPTVIACVCIHLACKWSKWEIPVSTDGKNWWEYVDGSVTLELLDGELK